MRAALNVVLVIALTSLACASDESLRDSCAVEDAVLDAILRSKPVLRDLALEADALPVRIRFHSGCKPGRDLESPLIHFLNSSFPARGGTLLEVRSLHVTESRAELELWRHDNKRWIEIKVEMKNGSWSVTHFSRGIA